MTIQEFNTIGVRYGYMSNNPTQEYVQMTIDGIKRIMAEKVRMNAKSKHNNFDTTKNRADIATLIAAKSSFPTDAQIAA